MNHEELRRLINDGDWITHQDGCAWRRSYDGGAECDCGGTALEIALPLLARVAQAARRLVDAEFFYDALRDALNTPGENVDEGRAGATVEEMRLARIELRAALAALEER